jgi:hypothetical protein
MPVVLGTRFLVHGFLMRSFFPMGFTHGYQYVAPLGLFCTFCTFDLRKLLKNTEGGTLPPIHHNLEKNHSTLIQSNNNGFWQIYWYANPVNLFNPVILSNK